jgi:methanogenic corrinoid protein MtbC1
MTSAFDAYWAALAAGDPAAAVTVAAAERDRGVPLATVLDELVAAGQARVGRLWLADEWSVAQEHRATSVGEEVVAALVAGIAPPDPPRGTVVVTCADGEWHSLPSRIVAAALRDAGYAVTYLGASVPARHLTRLLHDVGPDCVALSSSLPLRLFHAREVIETARDAGVPVLVGGRGFGPQGRWGLALGADAWAPDAHSARALLTEGRLPAYTSPAPPLAPADDAVDRVRAVRGAAVDASLRALTARAADVAAYDERQRDRTEEDLYYILDFLAAALFVDDPDLFTDFVGWLDELLRARGVPTATFALGLDLLADSLREQVPDRPRLHAVLAAGRSVLD